MPWQQTIGLMEMIVKGTIIGTVVSAPMGPTGVLCIQRTLNKGRWYGFATGCGAALSDIIYAIITGYGMSFVVDYIEDPHLLFWMKLVGCALLFIFGIYTFRSNPAGEIRNVSHNKGSLVTTFLTGFSTTFLNPGIVFLFLAMFGQFTFIVPDNPIPQIAGYIFIIIGALLWWFVLSWLVDKVRNRFEERGLWIINRVIGVIVMIVSAVVAIWTLTGNSIPSMY
ncbi:MAG: LysE family translocator [Bacteroidaceae bacterium]|nr:LysE family translocator [Bacteroidaceae bacterium]